MNEVMTERKMKMTDAALNIICDALKLDKDYYETWKANIAAAFQDAYKNYVKDNLLPDNNWLHEVSNTAADNFLYTLINDGKHE